MTTMADLEARVAASEASHADYRAVLAVVKALGVNQRERALQLGGIDGSLSAVDVQLNSIETEVDDTNTRVRSLEDTSGEIKELLIRALG
jgi:hypothetical protein